MVRRGIAALRAINRQTGCGSVTSQSKPWGTYEVVVVSFARCHGGRRLNDKRELTRGPEAVPKDGGQSPQGRVNSH